MEKERKVSTQVVFKYLDKWPNVPNLTLAKKIYAENKELFSCVEHARSTVRMYRGRTGERNREEIKKKDFYDDSPVNFNPFNLPDSDAEDLTIFNIPWQYNNIAVIADMHIPYHDVEAMTIALNHCKELGCNAVLIDGDAIDYYQLSKFIKDPRQRSVAYELDCLASVLKTLQENFGKVFYKLGNHEERYQKYLFVKAPELLDVPDFKLENLMASRGVRMVEYIDHSIVMAGKLPVIHSHELGRSFGSPVNPARGAFLKTVNHCMVAHSHRTSQHTEHAMFNMITTFSIGCLCGLSPEFARINKWNHGFARITTEDDGAFDVSNYRIHKGRVWQ